MDLNEALDHFFASETYSMISRQHTSEGNMLRTYRSKYNNEMLSEIVAVNMLQKYGYKIIKQIKVNAPEV